MGVGHLAVGFAAKRWAPNTSLVWLVLAPIFVDLWWGLFILMMACLYGAFVFQRLRHPINMINGWPPATEATPK